MINRIKNNIKYICTRFTLIVSIVFGVISGVEVFIDWDTIGIVETKYKISVIDFTHTKFWQRTNISYKLK